jgi:hypothetical protein
VKDLSEQTWALYVLSGLPDGAAVIEQSPQLLTRVRGRISLPHFSWADKDSRAEFEGCLDGFYAAISKHAKIPEIQTSEWAFRIYCATGGLMRLLSNFLIELLAKHGEKKRIELSDFADAYKTFSYPNKGRTAILDPFDKDFMKIADSTVLAAVARIGLDVSEDEAKSQNHRPDGEDASRRGPQRISTRRSIPKRPSAPRRSRRN